ncbi:MAG: hypothetical protein IJX97_04125 [Clostridia bacterium]|nr:hypothetical protein [Clostridia bacterium]MBQ8720071.1 hypothetical protein [Clostridia bacterium]
MDESSVAREVLEVLPPRLREEILRVGEGRRDFWRSLSEVRVRAQSRCAIVLHGENIPLVSTVSFSEVADIVRRISHNSLYAYRDSINDGYIPMECGIRVGVCGTAKYEGGRRVGVSEVSSLVFRIPHKICDTGAALYAAFTKKQKGMLVYSSPGGGKTTALRSLAGLLGTGASAKRVVVVDERCEFIREDYQFSTVDIMRGYRRSEGIEIATRTLSAEVIIVDEIGSQREVASMLPLVRAGIPIIASLHASGLREALGRRLMQPLYEAEAFEIFAGIFRTGAAYRAEITDKEGVAC